MKMALCGKCVYLSLLRHAIIHFIPKIVSCIVNTHTFYSQPWSTDENYATRQKCMNFHKLVFSTSHGVSSRELQPGVLNFAWS